MSHARPILVVEDSDEDFETVLDAAQRAGVANEVRRATNGADCLRLLREGNLKPKDFPALVLMDLNTPGIDGREALQEIKHDDSLRALPVIVLSASANPRDVKLCYANGVNAYHVKPVSHSDHLHILEQIFGYWLRRTLLPA